MTVTINGSTGVSLVQDNTITSAKIVDATIVGGAETRFIIHLVFIGWHLLHTEHKTVSRPD